MQREKKTTTKKKTQGSREKRGAHHKGTFPAAENPRTVKYVRKSRFYGSFDCEIT